MQAAELAALNRRGLERRFCAGSGLDAADLSGWEFRGYVAMRSARAVRLRRFAKGFVVRDNGVEGYNVWCSQRDGHRRRWRGRDIRHSFFVVRPATGHRSGCLLLDYAASPRNPRLLPTRLVRDVLVRPDPDSRDVLLGKAFVRLGVMIPIGFFVLERDRWIG